MNLSRKRYLGNLDSISALFGRCIPHLNYTFLDAISVLSESLDTIGIDEDLQNHHHCLLVILYLAHMYEDRFFSEGPLFTAVSSFLHTSLDRGHSLPPFVVRASIFLLSVCQEKCSRLDWVILGSICKLLEGISDFPSVYTCHLLVLKFFFHYPELTDRFGHFVLKCWFAHVDIRSFEDEHLVPNSQSDTSCVINIIQGNSNVLLNLLDMIHVGEMELAYKALVILKCFLRNCDNIMLASDLLRPLLLQILQRFTVENNAQPSEDHNDREMPGNNSRIRKNGRISKSLEKKNGTSGSMRDESEAATPKQAGSLGFALVYLPIIEWMDILTQELLRHRDAIKLEMMTAVKTAIADV
ncbi:meiosis inhibitor protein 1-like [Scyliorhinus torazame]|uniref:meiosis inhibitor protein 1-like n=1 Tax=Scyliorhinus torazame TaxID=75743 RepID=UPI003B5B4C38